MDKTIRKIWVALNHWGVAIVLILVLSIPNTLFAAAEVGEPFIRNFEPREYRGHLQVWCIAQDQRGVMFFGTSDNIVEFDGENWRQLVLPNKSIIRALTADQDGTIYVGSWEELGYLGADEQGLLVYQSLLEKIPGSERNFTVSVIYATSHGIYFCTHKKTFRWYQNKMSTLNISIGGGAYKVFDELYFLAGTSILRLREDKLEPLPHTDFLRDAGYAILLPFIKRNQVLIVTEKKDCFLYNLNREENSFGPLIEKFPTEIAGYLSENGLYRGSLQLRNQDYALGTRKGGIVIINAQGKLVRIINENRGLLNNLVLKLFQDQSDNLWAGMQGGIAYIEISSPVSCFGKLSGIRSTVLSVTRHRGRIYAGTFNQGPMVLNPYQLKVSDDSHGFSSIKNFKGMNGWNFLAVGKKLLVAADSVNVISDNVASIIKGIPGPYFLHSNKRFPNLIFVSIDIPWGGGLGLIEILGQGEFKYRGKLPGINQVIRGIVNDDQNNLWLTTQLSGILYVRFKGKDVTDFEVTRYAAEHGLPDINFNKIIWNHDHLLVGTYSHGIYKSIPVQDPKTNKLSFRFTPEFLPGKSFAGTPEDASQIIQYGLDKYLIKASGLGIITRQKNGIWQVDYNPFRGIEEIQDGTYVEEDGVVWIPSGNGLYRYNPHIKKNYDIPYSTLIRKVITKSGKEMFKGTYYDPQSKKGEFYSIFTTRQPETLIFTLPYHENSLTFQYSCLFFEQMQQKQFKYQLVGFDKKWSDWNPDNKAVYTNIPEGDYCFKVKGKNIFEKESGIAEYRFSISPPWYRTIFAYFGYVILFVLMMFGGIRLNTRRLRAAHKKLEKIVEERTAEVVKQKDEITRQKNEIETYASDLYSTNQQLTETKNALWGEMELAKKIQTVLLPNHPQIAGYEIVAYMKPADEVGGDYYDIIDIPGTDGHPPQHWIVIGDVSGHGVSAGLVMMMVQSSIRSTLQDRNNPSPDHILRMVNRVIHENIQKLGEEKYMTITLMSMQKDGAVYYSGLHQDIMIFRENRQEVELVETKGIWIGLMDDISGMIGVDQLRLHPGDVMFLYTDGLTEALDANDQMFSEEKLLHIIREQGNRKPAALKESILKALENYICADDVTFVIVQRLSSS